MFADEFAERRQIVVGDRGTAVFLDNRKREYCVDVVECVVLAACGTISAAVVAGDAVLAVDVAGQCASEAELCGSCGAFKKQGVGHVPFVDHSGQTAFYVVVAGNIGEFHFRIPPLPPSSGTALAAT